MSAIEWTDKTWNPFVGCSKISEGCRNCYAINQAYRNSAIALTMPNTGRMRYYEGLTQKKGDRVDWTGIVRFVPEALEIPLRWKKPRKIFVNSMSDLFHESIPRHQIDQTLSVMSVTPQHTYQILTKRPDLMEAYFCSREGTPMMNVMLGCTIENQNAVSDRAHHLEKLHKRGWRTFYSVEPLLEQMELYLNQYRVDWVIIGGESGPGARAFHLEWAQSLIQQCRDASIPPFMKQLGSNPYENGHPLKLRDRKGANLQEWPEALRM
jgi:protein gp37